MSPSGTLVGRMYLYLLQDIEISRSNIHTTLFASYCTLCESVPLFATKKVQNEWLVAEEPVKTLFLSSC